MTRVSAGDGDAFSGIVDRYKDPLVNYLAHLVRSREHAEEIAQEAFVRLYQNAGRYCAFERIAPHLFRIATNQAISEMRRQKRWRLLLPRLVAGTIAPTPQPDAGMVTDEIQRKVNEALSALPLNYRAPLALYEIEEWSYDDIARALGCRVGTVKSRIFRARELMRRTLADWWIGERNDRQRDWRGPETASAHEPVASLHL